MTRNNWLKSKEELSGDTLVIDGFQVMQEWEKPIMEFLAKEVCYTHGDVLEIGFGMGISANMIQEEGCKSHTIIEAHPRGIERAKKWAIEQKTPVLILEGFWEEVIESLGKYDGILFDTCPVTEKERDVWHLPFIFEAKKHLKKDGIFTYYSNESEDFNSNHLKMLLNNFDEVRLVKIKDLIPEDCEYWSEDYMIMPVMKKI